MPSCSRSWSRSTWNIAGAAASPRVDDYLGDWPELRDADGWLADDLVRFAEALRVQFGAASRCAGSASTAIHTAAPASDRPAEIPRTLGKFQLGKLLGKGSFGAVYLARDTEMNRVVAIKLLHAAFFSNPEVQVRFEREARIAGELHHPAILPVHEAGQSGGMPYLVTQYLEGETLAVRLRRQPLAPLAAAQLVAQIAQAVHYAHGRGVVHRDIKPGNILVDAAAQPYLTDFGLACHDADLTLTVDGQVLGTPAYMAPEQAGGNPRTVGPAADVYGLGAILYELVAGRPPFQAPSVLEIARAGALGRAGAAEPLAAGRPARSGDDLSEMPRRRSPRSVTRRPRRWPTTCGDSRTAS